MCRCACMFLRLHRNLSIHTDVYICICIYISPLHGVPFCLHTYIGLGLYIYIQYKHICMYVHMYVRVYLCIYVSMYLCIYVILCICVCLLAEAWHVECRSLCLGRHRMQSGWNSVPRLRTHLIEPPLLLAMHSVVRALALKALGPP